MSTFKKLKELRLAYARIPGMQTCKEYEIAIEIGYHQEIGQPLTLKQLLLLNIASSATVRRYLERLVEDGMVTRCNSSRDRRKVHLELSASAHDNLCAHFAQVSRIVDNSSD